MDAQAAHLPHRDPSGAVKRARLNPMETRSPMGCWCVQGGSGGVRSIHMMASSTLRLARVKMLLLHWDREVSFLAVPSHFGSLSS